MLRSTLHDRVIENVLAFIGPIPWGYSGPLCHALSLLSMLLWDIDAQAACDSGGVPVATPGEWQCKTDGVRRLAVANGPNIFQMLLVVYISTVILCPANAM